jgi:hypothetical protein
MSPEFKPTTPVQLGSDEFRARLFSVLGSHDPDAQNILRRYADMDGFGEVSHASHTTEAKTQQPDVQPQTSIPTTANNAPKPKRRSVPERVQPIVDPVDPITSQPADNLWRGGNRPKPVPVTIQPDIPSEPWNDPRASCYTKDESFFEDKIWESAARALCNACVLHTPCLIRELDMPSTQGIRGGLDEGQRNKLRRMRQNGLTRAQGAKYVALKAAQEKEDEEENTDEKA